MIGSPLVLAIGMCDSPCHEPCAHAGCEDGLLCICHQYDMLIQAALAGRGVALGRVGLVRPLVEEGRLLWLAAPRPSRATTHACWLVPAEEQPRSEVRAVAGWIQNEAAGSEAQ